MMLSKHLPLLSLLFVSICVAQPLYTLPLTYVQYVADQPGHYTVQVRLGSPANVYNLIVDTGTMELMLFTQEFCSSTPAFNPGTTPCYNPADSSSYAVESSSPITFAIVVDGDVYSLTTTTGFERMSLDCATCGSFTTNFVLGVSETKETSYFYPGNLGFWQGTDGTLGITPRMDYNWIFLNATGPPSPFMSALSQLPTGQRNFALKLSGSTPELTMGGTTYAGVLWSSYPVNYELGYPVAVFYKLHMCGHQILPEVGEGMESFSWQAIMDTGAVGLSLPGELFDSVIEMVSDVFCEPVEDIYGVGSDVLCHYNGSSVSTLPSLSFQLSLEGSDTISIPLSQLVVQQNGKNRLYLTRSPYMYGDFSGRIYISFGTLVISALDYVVWDLNDDDRPRLGLKGLTTAATDDTSQCLEPDLVCHPRAGSAPVSCPGACLPEGAKADYWSGAVCEPGLEIDFDDGEWRCISVNYGANCTSHNDCVGLLCFGTPLLCRLPKTVGDSCTTDAECLPADFDFFMDEGMPTLGKCLMDSEGGNGVCAAGNLGDPCNSCGGDWFMCQDCNFGLYCPEGENQVCTERIPMGGSCAGDNAFGCEHSTVCMEDVCVALFSQPNGKVVDQPDLCMSAYYNGNQECAEPSYPKTGCQCESDYDCGENYGLCQCVEGQKMCTSPLEFVCPAAYVNFTSCSQSCPGDEFYYPMIMHNKGMCIDKCWQYFCKMFVCANQFPLTSSVWELSKPCNVDLLSTQDYCLSYLNTPSPPGPPTPSGDGGGGINAWGVTGIIAAVIFALFVLGFVGLVLRRRRMTHATEEITEVLVGGSRSAYQPVE